jgi:hypothetical protein
VADVKGLSGHRRVFIPALALPNSPDPDPDLAEVMDAWPALPDAVRAGILAMVKASVP